MTLSVLKVSDAWSYTAEADNLVRMARELSRRGHRVVVGCTKGTPLDHRAVEAGLEVRNLPGLRPRGNPVSLLRAVIALRRAMRDLDPDIVHAYRSPPHVLAALALAGGRARARLVRTRGTVDAPRRTPLNRMLYGPRTAATIVTAEVVRRQCIAAGLDAARLETVYGALEIERFDASAYDRATIRAEFGLPADAIVVTHLARLAPVKGQEYLLRAAPAILEAEPRAHFVFVGPAWPGMDEKVRGWAADNGVASKITITGKVADVARILAAADVGVVASVGSEALSRATLEYMAMALPVVATRVGSLPEIVDDGVTGLLVEPRDAAALAAAIGGLLRTPARRAAMGRAGRASVENRFGVAAQADRLEAIYSRIAPGRYPAAAPTPG